ncbi:iron(III) transport system ATP-binding protein [Allopseudospirillum japonicum]|uniref:Iron(III) transport system ATP-binding protein n=1 Tax=Allopseudospirillum japonicum TaxID=64971 RepID=A0A1H6Q2I7_9GAMM|nr:ABC transporter ATP-binding protein [Allopseudospirillum japonicum]SEI38059.1 iron(III) transport system ATP-binding protein [Allopseudospirillum japonicum]
MGNEALLQLEGVECRYADQVITTEIHFVLREGEIACLLGPSGCGKTTLLRTLAGFAPVSQGRIQLGKSVIAAPDYQCPPEKRRIGMVFQDYALFPHLDVRTNIAFGLQKSTLNQVQIQARVDELLAVTGLQALAQRYPHELSGGQQQRVALARALAPQPQLILLDEPFSNLDVELRRHLGQEVRSILKQLNMSAILVTHDQQEAFAMADQVGVLYQQKLQQWDTPFNLYHEPANRFVATFIGQGSFIAGTLLSHESVETELGVIVGNRAYPWQAGTCVDVLLRPDDFVLAPENGVPAVIKYKQFAGSSTLYGLRLASGTCLEALFNSHAEYECGQSIGIQVRAEHLILFAQEAKCE